METSGARFVPQLPGGVKTTFPLAIPGLPVLTQQGTGSRLLRGLQHIRPCCTLPLLQAAPAASLTSAAGSPSSSRLQRSFSPRISDRHCTRSHGGRTLSLTVALTGSNVLSTGFRLFLRTHNFTSKKKPVDNSLCEFSIFFLIMLWLLMHTPEKKNLFFDL